MGHELEQIQIHTSCEIKKNKIMVVVLLLIIIMSALVIVVVHST